MSYGQTWEKIIRPTILRRDLYRCQWCGDRATEVDHVIPPRTRRTRPPDEPRRLMSPVQSETRVNRRPFPQKRDR